MVRKEREAQYQLQENLCGGCWVSCGGGIRSACDKQEEASIDEETFPFRNFNSSVSLIPVLPFCFFHFNFFYSAFFFCFAFLLLFFFILFFFLISMIQNSFLRVFLPFSSSKMHILPILLLPKFSSEFYFFHFFFPFYVRILFQISFSKFHLFRIPPLPQTTSAQPLR